jgi:hypothetical protein
MTPEHFVATWKNNPLTERADLLSEWLQQSRLDQTGFNRLSRTSLCFD